MIVDKCPAHPKVQGLKAIKLICLPRNTTSKTLLTCDSEVEVHYSKLVVLQQLKSYDSTAEPNVINVIDP